jgi:hypoxanthine phosphoribosyltransferase
MDTVAQDSMTRSPSKLQYAISWDETYALCNNLIREIMPIRHKLHAVHAIANGGTIPAAMLAYKLHLDLKIIHEPPLDFRQEGILLCDDVWDTGKTIREYVHDKRWNWEATLGFIVKPWCPYKPTFAGLETEEWIEFSWERN